MAAKLAVTILLAVSMVAVPLVAGLLAGRRLRRRSGERPWPRRRTVALVAVPAVLAFLPIPGIGTWDLLEMVLLFGAGLAVAARPGPRAPGRPGVPGWVGQSVVALAILEGGARWVLPTPPFFPPPWDIEVKPARAEYPILRLEGVLPILYPDRYEPPDDPWQEPGSRGSGYDEEERRRGQWDGWTRAAVKVLHTGDSMIRCNHDDLYAREDPVADAAIAGVWHLNRGYQGTGPDFHYLAARTWVPAATPDVVVEYLFVGNDVHVMDLAYSCCDDGPLLDFGTEPPSWRCPEPRWGVSRTLRFLHDPLPYPWRVATVFSAFARHVVGLHLAVLKPRSPPVEERLEHIGAALRATRDSVQAGGAKLVVVVLPLQNHLFNGSTGEDPIPGRMLEIARSVGVPVLDAWEPLAEAVREHGDAPYFNASGDQHFTPEGHRLLWQWIRGNLQGLGLLPR